MNELKIFENPAFGAVRTIVKDNEPWFVAADVCRALYIGNPTQALSRLEDDEKFTTLISNEGAASGKSSMSFINEPGLYSLVLGSRKPEARAFKRWITHDVIPDIRRHGMYATPDTVDKLLNDPDTAIIMLQRYKEERDKRLALEVQAEQNKPKVLFADSVAASRQSILIGELAKLLKQNGVQIGQNRLFQELRKDGYLCRGGERYNQPTQRSMEAGWMEIKESTVVQPNGSTRITKTPKITGSGQIYFINRYLGKN